MNQRNSIFFIFGILLYCKSFGGLGSKIENNLATEALKNGDLKKGEAHINKALEDNASDPTVLFNWASTQLHVVLNEVTESKKDALSENQKKRVESANAEFEKLLKSNSSDLKKIKKELLYQNAQALELLEKNQEALLNYYQSLNLKSLLRTDPKDSLDEKTKINIAHLLNKMSSSNSQKQKGGGGGQGDSKDKDPSEEGGEQNKDSQGKQGESGQQNRREPEFSGTDVSESQAQQILNSVSNQDRQVQQRKGQQQSKQNMQDGEFGEVSPRENHKPW